MPQPQQKVQHNLMTVIVTVTVTSRRMRKIGDRSHDLLFIGNVQYRLHCYC